MAPEAPAAVTLLRGHLHPFVLLLRLLDGLRQALFALALGVVVDPLFLALAAVVFLVHLGHGVLRYLTFSYVLTTDELVVREGLLHRQERRIPIDRVQDLGFESTLLRRALGLAVVRVETASSQGVEAALDSLSYGEAERLREALLDLRQRRTTTVPEAAAAAPTPAVEPEWIVHRAQSGMLLLKGLTDLRFGAILVAGLGAYELAEQLGALAQVQGLGQSFFAWLRSFSWGFVALLLALVVFAALGLSVGVAAVGNFMAFYGFVLSLRADSLLCRFGLLTRRQKALPRARIQRVRIEQTWLRRLLGVATARAISAGSGRGAADEAPGGFDVVVPLAGLREVEGLLPALLPGLEAARGGCQRASRRLVARVFLRSSCDSLVVLALLWPWAGPYAMLALLWAGAGWILAQLHWRNLAYGLWDQHLYLRWGILGAYQTLLPTAKVQAVALRQGPLQRLFGLCDLWVFIAGGAPSRVPDLEFVAGQRLHADLLLRAEAAAVREWHVRRL